MKINNMKILGSALMVFLMGACGTASKIESSHKTMPVDEVFALAGLEQSANFAIVASVDDTQAQPISGLMMSADKLDAVIVDIVDVKLESNAQTAALGVGESGVDLLNKEAFNFLFAAQVELPESIKMLRLMLGESSQVIIGGESFALETPSSQESGYKLIMDASCVVDLQAKLLIELKLEVIKAGAQKYILKPTAKAKCYAGSDPISDPVDPIDPVDPTDPICQLPPHPDKDPYKCMPDSPTPSPTPVEPEPVM